MPPLKTCYSCYLVTSTIMSVTGLLPTVTEGTPPLKTCYSCYPVTTPIPAITTLLPTVTNHRPARNTRDAMVLHHPTGANSITPRDPVGTPRFRGDHQPQYCRGCSASNARAHTEANHRSEQCQYCRHWVILLRAYTQATRTMGSQTVMPLEAP